LVIRCPLYPESGHWRCTNQCPLWAKSGLMRCNNFYSITSSARYEQQPDVGLGFLVAGKKISDSVSHNDSATADDCRNDPGGCVVVRIESREAQ
jgi:hypothetical protein